MDNPIQRERIDVARIRPDGMRFLSLVYDQSAVVAVKAGLVAVWWWEDRRNNPKVERCVHTCSARQNIVGVVNSNAAFAWRGRRNCICKLRDRARAWVEAS